MNQVTYSTTGGGLLSMQLKQHMNAGVMDLVEEHGNEVAEPLVERVIKSDNFEDVKKDVLNVFEKYLNKSYTKGKLKNSYYALISIRQTSSQGPSPQSIHVEDWSFDNQIGGQIISIDQEKYAKSKYSVFISSIRTAWEDEFEKLEKEAPEIIIYSESTPQSLMEYCEPPSNLTPASAINHYRNCILNYFISENYPNTDFLDDFRIKAFDPYPQWSYGNDKVVIEMRYKLPNGQGGSSYYKTITPQI